MNTDYGSLAEHLEADSEDEYIRLEGEEYQRYRMEMIEIDRGIEVYLIMKIREFTDMIEEDPGDEDLPEGLQEPAEDHHDPRSRRKEDGDRSPEMPETIHLPRSKGRRINGHPIGEKANTQMVG